MNKLLFNLQLFGEGGDGGTGAGAEGTAGDDTGIAGAVDELKSKSKGKGDSLSDVIYGKQSENENSIADSQNDTEEAKPQKTKSQSFEDLIKGEYKDEFQKRTQSIIDRRFKETKGLEEELASHKDILNMLSEKYGVDASDPKALQKALENDESFYEQEAIEKGLTVNQLKELKRLERENEEFRRAEAEAEHRQKTQEIYSKWMNEAEALKAKYGLTNFSLEDEVQNEDFTSLLRSGVSVESAYKAVHMDDMIGGAMAQTANNVRQQMSNSIASRQSRPSENGISNTTSKVFKTDVGALTKADREEIERRVMRGAVISF